MFLWGKQRAIAQTFAVVTGHAELYGRKKSVNEIRFLIRQILPDAFRYGYLTPLQFDYSQSNAIDIDHKIRAFGVAAYNGDFLRNIEVVLSDILEVDEIHRFRCLISGFLDLGAILQ